MIEQRLTAAITKLENKHDGIPLDERITDNRDYTRLVMVIGALKKYQETIAKISEKLTQLGV